MVGSSGAWIDGKDGLNLPGTCRKQLDDEPVRQHQPVRSLVEMRNAQTPGCRNRGIDVLAHHAEMGEAAFGALEIRVCHQVPTTDHPGLARRGFVAIDIAHRHAEHFAKEADMPVDILHLERDVFEIRLLRMNLVHHALSTRPSPARSIPLTQATSVALTGVGTPVFAPARTTAPLMKSTFVTEPFSRLCSIDVLNSGGRPLPAFTQASCGCSVSSEMPLALATAIASATAAVAVASSSGTA